MSNNSTESARNVTSFEDVLNTLRQTLDFVSDDTFSWEDVVSTLVIKLSNTDSINKDNPASNATQIQLTSERNSGDSVRKTEDFFPSLVLNQTFKSWRLSVPVRINAENIRRFDESSVSNETSWLNEKIQLRRRLLNGDENGNGNPNLQMCYGNDIMPLRRVLGVGDYLVFVKRKNAEVFEAFGVSKEVNLGSGKQLYVANNAQQDASSFDFAKINDSSTECLEIEEIPDDLSVEALGKILSEMYNHPLSQKTTAIHMFAIKYGKIISEKNYSGSAIITAAGINPTYSTEINEGVNLYKSILKNEYGILFADGTSAVDNTENSSPKNVLPQLSKRAKPNGPFNSILYGAPGTGKTYATAQYAVAIIENKSADDVSKEPRADIMQRYNSYVENKKIVFTTFHQNYGYEDFIQGIRPDTSGKEMTFKTVDGVFKSIADKAMHDANENYVIIIDEINRANISKVFGELITLIEADKRWGEDNAISITLPSGDVFAVPNNLYIVGTMNSADKSISLIDTALRRRFEFIEYVPNLTLINDEKLKAVLEKLNIGIAAELNSTDLLVGHSYFMNRTQDDICEIMNRSIIPLLYEYFFDNHKKVEAQVKKAVEGLDVEIESSIIGRIKLKQKGSN